MFVSGTLCYVGSPRCPRHQGKATRLRVPRIVRSVGGLIEVKQHLLDYFEKTRKQFDLLRRSGVWPDSYNEAEAIYMFGAHPSNGRLGRTLTG